MSDFNLTDHHRLEARTPPSDARSDLRVGYLRGDAIIEPLIDGWYAWPHLLAPVQQALNLAYRYLPTLRSFVLEPDVHVRSAADPATYGGPFVDLPRTAVARAQAYLDAVQARRTSALGLAEVIRDFDRALQNAEGYSLDNLRQAAPADLQGRIELVYDLNNHPKLRLLEEMFDADDLGLRQVQQLRLHCEPQAERGFFLSTPRLGDGADLLLSTPFDSEASGRLFAARTTATDIDDLAGALGAEAEQLRPFFTPGSPPAAPPYQGQGVRVRYFGHAALLIETAEVAILVDPTLAYTQTPDAAPHFTLGDLPAHIDLLFISHGHQDHLTPEFLLQLRDRIGTVLIPPSNRGDLADPSLERMLRRLGFTSIRTLEPLRPEVITGGAVTALPFSGEHCDLDVHSKQCALVELKGRRICLFVDSDAIDIEVYRRLQYRLAEPDLMFVGMECFGAPLSWLYGPLAFSKLSKRNDASRRLSGANCRRASDLVDLLNPRRVCVYAMGQEPWMKYLMGLSYTEDSIQLSESRAFLEHCRNRGIQADRLYLHMESEL